MTAAYAFWQAALKGTAPTAVVDDPQPGFWRLKRHGLWVPVAVWPKSDGLGFKIGAEIVGTQIGTEQWPRYCANPITEAEFRKVEAGGQWSDADPVVAAMLENGGGTSRPGPMQGTTSAPQVRDDSAGGDVGPHPINIPADPTEEFREQIATASAGLTAYAKIETDESSVRAASLRNMLLKLAGDADKAREAEKAPHLKAGRDVDTKWQPLIRDAQTAAQKLRTAMEGWENDKRQAANRAAQEQARRDEQARQAAAQAAARNEPAPPPPPPVQSNAPAPVAQVKPTYGKAASVGSRMEVTGIDADKLLAALKARAEWGQVEAFLFELAQKLANKGIILDGVTATEKAQIR